MTDFLTVRSRKMRRRYRAEQRFQWYGRLAIILALGFLIVMLASILWEALPAFKQTRIGFDVSLARENFEGVDLKAAPYGKILKEALRKRFPDAKSRKDRLVLYRFVSADAEYSLRDAVLKSPDLIGKTSYFWFVASDDIDMLAKGKIDMSLPQKSRLVKDRAYKWIEDLQRNGDLEVRFSSDFLTRSDSREPELSGILSALTGSLLTLLVCFLISFPIAIMAAVYLQEYMGKGYWSEFLEININNLSAVPSIVFGLLGLAICQNLIGMPRSSPLIGGTVLSLMTLPTIIIAARAALRAVPPSIREAALGLGASRMQVTFHHVVPLALPGMLTGTIIGMARALGDTAPLLMVGMVAFVVDIPKSILDPATALPVQIFLWADSPELAFFERTAAAIVVLLFFLILMNLSAIVLRWKFERRF